MERRTVGLVVVLIAVVLAEISSDAATTYEVGGSTRWVIPPNTSFYEEWAEGKTFHVGDILCETSLSFSYIFNIIFLKSDLLINTLYSGFRGVKDRVKRT